MLLIIRCIYAAHTLHIRCLYAAYMLHIRCIYTLHIYVAHTLLIKRCLYVAHTLESKSTAQTVLFFILSKKEDFRNVYYQLMAEVMFKVQLSQFIKLYVVGDC